MNSFPTASMNMGTNTMHVCTRLMFKTIKNVDNNVFNKGLKLSAKYPLKQSCRCLSISTASHNSHGERFLPLNVLSEEESMFKESAKRFCAEHVTPFRKQFEEENGVPASLIQKFFDNGFMSVLMPQQYGGSGCNLMAFLVAGQEICKADMGVGTLVVNHNMLASGFFRNFASDLQKERYFERICKSSLAAASISETDAGSDAFAMKTTAEKKGDYFVLNGTKMWVTSADHAEIFTVMATVDKSKGYRGVTCFIIERGQEGFTIGPKEDKLGIRASGTCPLILEDVKVHESNVLGEVGKGYKYVMAQLGEGRVSTAIQGIGVAEACMEDMISYVTERKQFGQRIWDFQAMQHQIAEALTRLEASRLLTYNAIRKQEAGEQFVLEASMAKYYATETMSYIASKCVDWTGGVGFTTSYPFEKYYRDCKIAQIYEGTSNIQLNTIAKYWERKDFKIW